METDKIICMQNFWIGCLVIFICRLLAAWVLPTYDDAFITYRYASNIVAGNGFVYNVGEKVMGTTAPLFAVIASIPLFLKLPIQKFFLFFNICCDLLSLYLAYKYIFKNNTIAFLLMICFFAIDPMMNRVCIGGMEVNLFLLLSLSGLVLYFKNKKNYGFALLSAIYFLRPEAVILVFILLCYDFFSTRTFPVKYSLITLAVLGLPTLLIYSYYGHMFSQSVFAKNALGRDTFQHLIKNIFFPDPLFFILVPLAIYGFIKQSLKNELAFLLGLWGFTYAIAYLIRGPFMWSWYTYSIDFVILVFASFGMSFLLKQFPLIFTDKKTYFCIMPLVILTWVLIAVYKGRSGVEAHVYAPLKDFGSTHELQDKIIFAEDIGAIGYFTKAYMYDQLGLVTPSSLTYQSLNEKLINLNADFLYIYSDLAYVNLIKKDPVLGKKYSFYKRYSINGETKLPQKNQEHYRQDYVLFKKN